MYTPKSVKDLVATLKRHAKWNRSLEKKIMAHNAALLLNSGDPFSAGVLRMYREVLRDVERVRQYSRTRILGDRYLVGEYASPHRIHDMALQFFAFRFPDKHILLYNRYLRKTFIRINVRRAETEACAFCIPFLNGAIIEISGGLQAIMPNLIEEETASCTKADEIYRKFYESQYIEDRDNPRYFRRMLPLGVERKYRLTSVRHPRQKTLDF